MRLSPLFSQLQGPTRCDSRNLLWVEEGAADGESTNRPWMPLAASLGTPHSPSPAPSAQVEVWDLQSPSARCHPIRGCGGPGLSLLVMQLLLLLPAWQDAEQLLPLIFAPSQQPSAWLVVCRHSLGIKPSQICAEVLVQGADLLPHCPRLFMACASLSSPKHEFTLGFVFSSLTDL